MSRGYDMMSASPVRISGSWRDVERLAGGRFDLRPPEGMLHPRTRAIVLTIGSLLVGLGLWLVLTAIEIFFTFLGGSRSSVPIWIGVGAAVVGVVISWATYRSELALPHVAVAPHGATFLLPGFRKPVVVSRANVRVVSLDDSPVKKFRNNKRFPIMGALPAHVFADALERRGGLNIWEPGEPSPVPAGQTGTTGGTSLPSGAPVPEDAIHEDGWANVGGGGTAAAPEQHGYLFSGDGAALPWFAAEPMHLPNVAVIFRHPARIPRRSTNSRTLGGTRSSMVKGLLLAAKDLGEVERAFASWNVIRPITAEDVLEEGLRLPKPLTGLRAVAFAVVLFAPVILRMLSKWLG